MQRFFFPKELRILKFSENICILKNFDFIKTEYFKIYSKNNYFIFPRIGILIKKKYVKFSYNRNKLRRIIKESFRLNKFLIKNLDFIFIFNKKINIINNILIFNDINKIWNLKKNKI